MAITTKQQRQQRRSEALQLLSDGVPPTDAATQLSSKWGCYRRTSERHRTRPSELVTAWTQWASAPGELVGDAISTPSRHGWTRWPIRNNLRVPQFLGVMLVSHNWIGNLSAFPWRFTHRGTEHNRAPDWAQTTADHSKNTVTNCDSEQLGHC